MMTESATVRGAQAGLPPELLKPEKDRKIVAVSPRNGQALPAGPGRPKGQKSRLINLRDAVLEAFDQVGGAEYLVKLANGTQSDRAAFTGLVAKVLPTQINQTVDGGIRIELGWLGQRRVGTEAAQIPDQQTQVIDLQRDSRGKYQIVDPQTQPAAGAEAAEAVLEAAPATAQEAAGGFEELGGYGGTD